MHIVSRFIVAVVITLLFSAYLITASKAEVLYFTDHTAQSIQTVNLDGSGLATLIAAGVQQPDGITVDPQKRKLYWAERTGLIRRANLDGSNIQTLLDVGGDPRDVAIDSANQKLYWIEFQANRIRRANLDGSGVEIVNDTDVLRGHSILVDAVNDAIYWSDSACILRMRLDGSESTFVLCDNGHVSEFTLSVVKDELFWANQQFFYIGWVPLSQADVAPREIQVLADEPSSIAIMRNSQRIFSALTGADARIVELDRKAEETILVAGIGASASLRLATGPPFGLLFIDGFE